MSEGKFQRGGVHMGMGIGIGVSAAVLAGAGLRFWGIGRLSLWFDEGYTAWAIDHPVGQIARLIRADTAPPLYYLLLHGWSLIFGRSETALRSLSAVAGVASIGLVAGIARRTLADPAAVVAATWLFVLSFLQTWYSQEARGYELAVFLSALTLYALVRHLREPRWRWLGLLIAAAGLSLYVNNFMPLYVAAVGVGGLILPSVMPPYRRLRDGMIAAAALTLIYVPWLGALRSQLHRVRSGFWIDRPTLDSICNVLARTCGVGHFWSWDQFIHWLYYDVSAGVPRAGAVLLGAGILAALIFLRNGERRAAAGLAICAFLPPLAAAAYSQFNRSIFLPAGFVPSTVAASVLMAGPLAWTHGRKTRRVAAADVIALVLLCAANVCAYEHERNKEDWRGAARAVAQMPVVQRRLIVFVANEGELPFDYYYARRVGDVETGAPEGFFDVDPPVTGKRVSCDADLDKLRRGIVGGDYSDIVLVLSHADYADPDGRVERMVGSLARQSERIELYNVTIVRCVP